MIPKGRLLIIGGAEDKGNGSEESPEIKDKNRDFTHLEILSEMLPEKKSGERVIEVITTASENPRDMVKRYTGPLKKVGFTKVHFMNVENKNVAREPKLVERIAKTNAVLFTGGDQFRLSTILGGSPLIETMLEKYNHEKDYVVAGTSAGAMVMSKLMLYRGENNEALLKDEVQIASGFGFTDCCIIDTHFVKRGRFGRLAQAVVTNPICIGIGLGEDTALMIKKGNEAECFGSGMVMVIDGQNVGHTNIAYADEDTPICIENLKVHIMARGNKYLLRERVFLPSKEDLKKEKTHDKT